MEGNSFETLVLENGEYKTIIPKNRKHTEPRLSGHVLRSAIPGTVISVDVKVGQHVKRGDLLFVLDSMKMNNRICSQEEGIIKALYISAGDTVAKNAPMVEFE
ncbi:MAG: acetyl-CoA carboxylase biotin carboxyl carrier protein subunit [Bacteroidaceae bacterium]|nr:acetyl-CoA carboxylase biotin carboxyl carrier protein subunit [Bacteroidaceae bacterium]